MMILPDVLFYLALFATGAIVSGVVGFGSTLLFYAFLVLFGVEDLRPFFPLLAVVPFIKNIFSIGIYWNDIDWHYVKEISVMAVPLVFLGFFVGQYISAGFLKNILGFFTLLYVAWSVKTPNRHFDLPVWVERVWAGTFGLVSGLILAGGPVLVSLTQQKGFTHRVFVANVQALFFFTGLVKSIIFWPQESALKSDMVLLFGMLFLSLFGAWLGKKLLPYIPQVAFKKGVLFLLLVSGLRMIF